MSQDNCQWCGELLPDTAESQCCNNCLGDMRLDIYDLEDQELDSVDDWIQQTMNEELGLD